MNENNNKPNMKDLLNEMKDLKDRVTELEKTNDVTSKKISILDEVLAIISELPLGKALVNRAINRSELKYLKHVVLPRRQKELLRIQNEKGMPEELKDQFSEEEIDLINSAKRSISHRSFYEEKSSTTVREAFLRLHKFIGKIKTPNRHLLINHHKGRIHARNK